MRFITEDLGAPKSAGPVAIATFAIIVNPAQPPSEHSLATVPCGLIITAHTNAYLFCLR